VLEPQNTALSIGVMLVFVALTWWMVTARQVVFRVLAACLAFDVPSVQAFWRELAPRQPQVPLVLTRNGGHDMLTWRAEVPLMLRWMTPRLAQAARQEAVALAKAAQSKAGKSKASHSKAQPQARKRVHHHRSHQPVVAGSATVRPQDSCCPPAGAHPRRDSGQPGHHRASSATDDRIHNGTTGPSARRVAPSRRPR
jgi:hypothetical protein